MKRDACGWWMTLGWLSLLSPCHAWIPITSTSRTKRLASFGLLDPSSTLRIQGPTPSTTTTTTTALYAALPEGYREYGERVIRQAGNQCGLVNPDDLSIEWKAGRIVVTVHVQSYVSATDDDGMDKVEMDYDEYDDDEEEEGDDEDYDDDFDEDDNDGDDDGGLEIDSESVDIDDEDDTTMLTASEDSMEMEAKDVTSSQGGIDVSILARAINAALDDGGIGLAIAEVHEIEVTTPGASDELQGPIMFAAYKGFDVICRQEDSKTKKVKQIEGRLVERNSEFTIINVKGRIKKMKNSTVLSVKLPKAKKEKGK